MSTNIYQYYQDPDEQVSLMDVGIEAMVGDDIAGPLSAVEQGTLALTQITSIREVVSTEAHSASLESVATLAMSNVTTALGYPEDYVVSLSVEDSSDGNIFQRIWAAIVRAFKAVIRGIKGLFSKSKDVAVVLEKEQERVETIMDELKEKLKNTNVVKSTNAVRRAAADDKISGRMKDKLTALGACSTLGTNGRPRPSQEPVGTASIVSVIFDTVGLGAVKTTIFITGAIKRAQSLHNLWSLKPIVTSELANINRDMETKVGAAYGGTFYKFTVNKLALSISSEQLSNPPEGVIPTDFPTAGVLDHLFKAYLSSIKALRETAYQGTSVTKKVDKYLKEIDKAADGYTGANTSLTRAISDSTNNLSKMLVMLGHLTKTNTEVALLYRAMFTYHKEMFNTFSVPIK